MSARAKLMRRIVSGRADATIRFDDLRSLLRSLGFEERTRGSHHIFRHPDVTELINLQADGRHARFTRFVRFDGFSSRTA
jgi:hypothetical protein